MFYKVLLGSALVFACASAQAGAADFSGLNVHLYGGYGAAEYNAQTNSSANNLGDRVSLDDQERIQHEATFAIGHNWNLAPRVVTGIELGASTLTAEDRGNSASESWSTYTKLQVRRLAHLKGKFGYQMNDFLPYVTAGVSDARVRLKVFSENNSANAAVFRQTLETKGMNLGAGVEWMSDMGISLSLDGSKHTFSKGYTFKRSFLEDQGGTVDEGDFFRVNSIWVVHAGIGYTFS